MRSRMIESGSATARLGVVVCMLTALAGCRRDLPSVTAPVAGPDYARELAPGESALVKVDPSRWPDVKQAYLMRDAALQQAIDRSLRWYSLPSSPRYFPVAGITHQQMRDSLALFSQHLNQATSGEDFQQRLLRDFDLYMSVGWNRQGVVLFTGYYTPILEASPVATERFRYPLLKRPSNLVSDPVTGQTQGLQINGQVLPPPTRAQIESQNIFAGNELVWLADRFDAYLAQIQGSALLRMPDGKYLHIGYAGTNGYEYTSIAKLLVAEGKLDRNRLSLAGVRNYFRSNPDDLERYTFRNDRYTFFKPYSPDNWPAGSLGLKVTPLRTLATDKAIFPRGGIMVIDTALNQGGGNQRKFVHFVMDQDTGGAIRAPGRADLYIGVGDEAEDMAGGQYNEGRMFYFVLKPGAAAPMPVAPQPLPTPGPAPAPGSVPGGAPSLPTAPLPLS